MNKCKWCDKAFENQSNRRKIFCTTKCRVRHNSKLWKQKNKEKVREGCRRWRAANREKAIKSVRSWQLRNPGYQKVWYHKNKENARKYRRAWIEQNGDRIKEYTRSYYLENSDKIKTKSINYAKKNRNKINAYERIYKKGWWLKNKERIILRENRGKTRELGSLIHHFKTAIIDQDAKEKFAFYQLMKRVLAGKIPKEKIPEKIKLIQEGKTYEAYK